MFCASIDLPTPFGPDQHDVGCVAKELERHQRIDGDAVAAFWPTPVEVMQIGLKRPMPKAHACSRRSRLRRARSCCLPAEQRGHPGFGGDLAPMRQ